MSAHRISFYHYIGITINSLFVRFYLCNLYFILVSNVRQNWQKVN